jgi:DNA-binding CsgD family transcriptional regulator
LGLHEDMLATVDGLYAAAAGQAGWPAALDRFVDTMGFTHCSVYPTDKHVRAAATESYRLPVAGYWHRHDPSAQAAYEAEYYKYEPGRLYRLRHPDRRVYYDAMYGDDAELDRNAHYNWAEQEHGMRRFCYGQTDPANVIGAVIVLNRPRGRGHITPAEIERFTLLLAHFERAVQVEHHLGKALAPDPAALDFLDRNPVGIVILDGLGRPVRANRAAQDMAARNDSFVLQADRFAAIRARDDAALQRLVGGAARTAAGAGLASGGTLRLSRRSGKRDYLVTVSPLSRRDSLLSQLMPAVCVLIADPDAPQEDAAAMLRRAYGLTAAETRLVQRLSRGETPQQAAAALRISLSTVRWHLAAVLRKTETARQSELLRLLVSLPWWAGDQAGRQGLAEEP